MKKIDRKKFMSIQFNVKSHWYSPLYNIDCFKAASNYWNKIITVLIHQFWNKFNLSCKAGLQKSMISLFSLSQFSADSIQFNNSVSVAKLVSWWWQAIMLPSQCTAHRSSIVTRRLQCKQFQLQPHLLLTFWSEAYGYWTGSLNIDCKMLPVLCSKTLHFLLFVFICFSSLQFW